MDVIVKRYLDLNYKLVFYDYKGFTMTKIFDIINRSEIHPNKFLSKITSDLNITPDNINNIVDEWVDLCQKKH